MSGKWDKWYYYKPAPKGTDATESNATSAFDILIPILVCGILGAIGILGWQVYTYLKFGEWHQLSVITALRWSSIEWAFSPTKWIGIYKILDGFPLSLASFFAGIIPIGLWVWWDERPKAK